MGEIMKKILLLVVIIILALSFVGCSKTKTGNFDLYYEDEYIGTTHKIIISGDMVCVINDIYSYKDDFDYVCWDKDKLDYIEAKED